ncbi:hypothetical protein OJE16_06520 [Pantoea tagorei]
MSSLIYLQGYPENILQQVQTLIDNEKLGAFLQQRYPDTHDIVSDKALYDYTQALKKSLYAQRSAHQ